jgi:hypothetical protein
VVVFLLLAGGGGGFGGTLLCTTQASTMTEKVWIKVLRLNNNGDDQEDEDSEEVEVDHVGVSISALKQAVMNKLRVSKDPAEIKVYDYRLLRNTDKKRFATTSKVSDCIGVGTPGNPFLVTTPYQQQAQQHPQDGKCIMTLMKRLNQRVVRQKKGYGALLRSDSNEARHPQAAVWSMVP